MAKKITPALEEAILNLPVKEKNKLLIRLVNKEEILVDQLQYRLLENTESDLAYRREQISDRVRLIFQSHTLNYYKDLLYSVREGIRLINWHFKVTKDKKGELELLILLFKEALNSRQALKNNWRDQVYKVKFQEYSLTKITKMNTLLSSLHEDFRIEFEEDITFLQAGLQTLSTHS